MTYQDKTNKDGLAGSLYNRVLFAQNLEDGPIIVDRDMRGGLRISNGGTDDKLTDIPEILMENGMMVFNNASSDYETDSITFTKKTFYYYESTESRDSTTGKLANKAKFWKKLETGGGSSAGGLTYKGTCKVDDDATIPSKADNGDFYVNEGTGKYATKWAAAVKGVTTDTNGVLGNIVIYQGADDSTSDYADDSWDRIATGGTNLGLWKRSGTTLQPNTSGDNIGDIGSITAKEDATLKANGDNKSVTLEATGTGKVILQSAGTGAIELKEATTVDEKLTAKKAVDIDGALVTKANVTLNDAETETTTIKGILSTEANVTLNNADSETTTVKGVFSTEANVTLNNAATETVTINGLLTCKEKATFDKAVQIKGELDTKTMLPGRVDLATADVASVAPDFSAGEIFTIKATITTMNHPTNLKKGQTGIFVIESGGVTGWGDEYLHPGGEWKAPTAPAVIPYYVMDATDGSEKIYLGTPTADIK